VDANGEFVIFDAYGPGCLYRQQYNAWAFGEFKQAAFVPPFGCYSPPPE